MSEPFSDLGDAISDQRFVDVDLALRRGQHIDQDEADWYGYLLDAQAVLEPFYRRYGCELVHRSDGYFFLLPTGDKVAKRLLGLPEMIVGQGAALLFLDPASIESGGVVTKEDFLSHLAAVMGTDALVGVFNPKRKRLDERVAQETVRQRVSEGLRKLTQLGFVTVSEDNRIHLRSALMRFADPVRGAGSPRDALEKLIARGEVSIPSEATDEADDERSDEGSPSRGDSPPAGVEFIDPAAANEDMPEGDGDTAEDDTNEETLDDGFSVTDDEYDFDREDRDEDARSIEEGPEDDVGAEFDDFGIDFDEPAASKAVSPVQPAPPKVSPPPPPPEESVKKPRRKRKSESLHPQAEAQSTLPGSDEEPKFDEFD